MTETLATIDSGPIRGVSSNGVRVFLGVPYAAAPVGERRFAEPVAPAPWTTVRDATQPGASAPQIIKDFPSLDITPLVGVGWQRGDEYLNANIWAPASGEKLPVMVFIHGGAFVLGGNTAAVQDGTAFARSGVVMVAITYRVGVDGFMPIPGVPDNLGLRDQIEGLKWVRRNAAAFGGDPDNITVFGESAGAMSIADLVVSPLAKGLFHRAIIESGHGDLVRPQKVAERVTAKMARLLKIKATRDGFNSVSQDQTLAALEKISQPTTRIDLRDNRKREPAFGLSRFLPWMGGEVLPEYPMALLAKGAGKDVEVLIGSNAEEMNLYFVPTGVREKLPGWLATMLVKKSEPNAAKILKAYGLGRKGVKPGHAFTTALSDLMFRAGARRYAAAHQGRTHVYEFEWRSPAVKGQLGAAHGMELPFVFNTLACVTGPKGIVGENPPQALADRVHGIWVEFAKTGSLPWPEYSAADPQVYRLEAGVSAAEPPMPCAALLD
ncbi:MAG: carboxylesterase/lipase family protein [Brevundimonas sp.]